MRLNDISDFRILLSSDRRSCGVWPVQTARNVALDRALLVRIDGEKFRRFAYLKGRDNMTNLKRIRLAAGLSQSQLAEKSGVNNRMIQHYEQGAKDINKASALTVYRLAETLGCTVGDLLEIK